MSSGSNNEGWLRHQEDFKLRSIPAPLVMDDCGSWNHMASMGELEDLGFRNGEPMRPVRGEKVG